LPPGAQDGAASVELPEASTVADVVALLRVPPELSRIVLVNGHDVDDAAPLHDGDAVDIFPPLAGGAESRMVHSGGSGSV
jgi:molybdopterin converting factor small subunit